MTNINFKRIIATVIDFYIITFSSSLFITVITIGKLSFNAVTISAYFVVFVLSAIFKDYIFKDASIGKKIMKIRLVSENGEYVTFEMRLLRAVTLIFVPIELIMIITKNKRLGDYLAHTQVIEKINNFKGD